MTETTDIIVAPSPADFGIFDGALLVCGAVSYVRLPEGRAVGGIFTDPRYRGRGRDVSNLYTGSGIVTVHK